MIDLHLHTNMSDGSDAPVELVNRLNSMNCKAFSVTEHDDLRANNIIISTMKDKNCSMSFVTGIEFCCVFEGRNLHLLCYGFNPASKRLNNLISKGVFLRHERIKAMIKHLHDKHGITVMSDDVAKIFARDIPGKVHVYEAIKSSIIMNRSDFYDNCLNDMESRQFKLDAQQVIDVVTSAGGIVSFAHPIEVQKEYGIDFPDILMMSKKLSNIGLTGLEIYHSLHKKHQIEEYLKIAHSCGLLASAGSDYHGIHKDVKIGQLTNFDFSPDYSDITILNRLL